MKKEVKKEVLQWICKMEEIAAGHHLKTRLLDAIQDCKKELESKMTQAEWAEKSLELEELLGQMKKQLPGEMKEKGSEDEIEQRAFEILERCRRSNEILKSEYLNGSAAYIQEAERSMEEPFGAQEYYENVIDKKRFFDVFHTIGETYKMQMEAFQKKYVDMLHQNYQNAFDRLKDLFCCTGYDKEAQRKFYETYYENQDSLIRDSGGYIQHLEQGQSSIAEYAEKVHVLIQKTVKRMKRKTARKKWMPVVLFLLMIALGITSKIALERMDANEQKELASQESAAAETENASGALDSLSRAVDEKIDKVGENAIKAKVGSGLFGTASGIVLMILMPLALLLFVLYWLWMKRLDRHCRNRITEEAEMRLRTAMKEWKQQEPLLVSMRESFDAIEAYVDQGYQKLLTQLLDGQKKTDPEGAEFAKLCYEWENIKRKVEF